MLLPDCEKFVNKFTNSQFFHILSKEGIIAQNAIIPSF